LGLNVRTALYKVEYSLGEAVGRSVMYARDGVMLGGNSGFAHIGRYTTADDGEIQTELSIRRHHDDPSLPSLLGADEATLVARGRDYGSELRFQGESPQLPGVVFRSVMTQISEDDSPPPGVVKAGGIPNGLYSLHIQMLDGLGGGNTGVMLLLDGRILGGDAFFYYLGSYSSEPGRWKGEMVNQEHTPAKHAKPLFGGHQVGIGFAGTWEGEHAEVEATALAGKRSIRFSAKLQLLRALD
jgi:hypothetical protein